jgi:hypothetical protein
MDRTGIFISAVLIFVVSLIAIAAYYYRRARKSNQNDWDNLLNRLTRVDRSSIAEVALDVIDESGRQRTDQGSAVLEPQQIWKLLGGMEGIEALKANCTVLIDLAFYLQQQYPEALVVTEQLRLSAREIEWQVGRLRGAAESGKLAGAFPMYGQRAAAAYYLMTQRLLDLYQQGDHLKLTALQKAL